MPIYEYECGKCNEMFEIKQKITEDALQICIKEECSGKVRRVISSAGIQFKGSGWYVTDYSDKMKDKSKSSESKQEEKKPAKTEPPCAAQCDKKCNSAV